MPENKRGHTLTQKAHVMLKNSVGLLIAAMLCLMPSILHAQRRVEVYHHDSTAEGNILRGRADAVIALSQARLIHEQAIAQRLENLIRECDVVYKRFSTLSKIRKEALANKYEHIFDIIKFNQQLADIRSELEQKAVMKHTRIGDLTGEMNHLLETFTRQSLKATNIPVMKTELTSEQLDAIFLTDGSNTFSGKTGKTRLESFKWPFLIQRKEFQAERGEFEKLCDQAVKEINENNSPSPETIGDLLKQTDAIDKTLDSLPLSDSPNVRAVENKWRKEAKAFIRELTKTLGDTSRLDSEKLSKYAFRGKTLGELIDHLNAKGLRFSHPNDVDANLYASIFFAMRYAYQGGKSDDANNVPEKSASNSPAREIVKPELSMPKDSKPSTFTYKFSSREAVLRDFGMQGNWDVVSNELVFRDGPPSKATSKAIFSYPIFIEYQMYFLPDHPFDIFPGFADIQLYYACYSNTRTRLRLGNRQIELPHVKAVPNHLYRIEFVVNRDRILVIKIDNKDVVRQRVDEQVSLKGPIIIDGEFGHVGCRKVVVRTAPSVK